MMNFMSESTAVGIIGGADDPTAVFVSGDPTTLILAAVGIAAAVLAVVGIILWKKQK